MSKKLAIITEDVFSDLLSSTDLQYTMFGHEMSFKLDKTRRYLVSLGGCVQDEYDTVVLKVVDTKRGEIERKSIPFHEIFESAQDLSHPSKIDKHIWEYRGKCSWYGKPTRKDIQDLNDTVKRHMDFWK